MQHQQHRSGDLQRSLGNLLPVLLLLASAPLLTGSVARRGLPLAPPVSALDPELGVPVGAPLHSLATDQSLSMDGVMDAAWGSAEALPVPLHFGLHGQDPAGTLHLRSLYDEESVYFLALWNTETPGGDPDAWRNLLTVHWRLVDPGLVSGETTGSSGLACTVACHTATADGQGHLVGIRSETIPPGLSDDLPAGGGWADGRWVVEWSRPRISDSPYDQNLTEREQGYRFFVKVFQGQLGQPDPVSDVHELRLGW